MCCVFANSVTGTIETVTIFLSYLEKPITRFLRLSPIILFMARLTEVIAISGFLSRLQEMDDRVIHGKKNMFTTARVSTCSSGLSITLINSYRWYGPCNACNQLRLLSDCWPFTLILQHQYCAHPLTPRAALVGGATSRPLNPRVGTRWSTDQLTKTRTQYSRTWYLIWRPEIIGDKYIPFVHGRISLYSLDDVTRAPNRVMSFGFICLII